MKKKSAEPMVALVGRPNVGKSRLFNRFIGARRAIVEDSPGVTRDRNYGKARWGRYGFSVIDTGGFEPESRDVLLEQMREQAQLAVEEADLILFVVDARAGLLPADWQIAEILRRSNKRILLVVNKVDQHKLLELSYEFYELAFEELFAVSAEHGLNFDLLLEAVTRDFPENIAEDEPRYVHASRRISDNVEAAFFEEGAEAYLDEAEGAEAYLDEAGDEAESEGLEGEDELELYHAPAGSRGEEERFSGKDSCISIAVLGKPNTGKSTLINRLLGYKRLLTADIAGTTRDSIDSELEGPDGQSYILIDTAGIRRKSTVSHRLEKFSIVKALDAVERADVVLLLVDAREGVTDQDQKIASLAIERGCALGLLLNKWDVIENKTDQTATEYIKEARERLAFLEHIPIFTISALTGMRTHKILDMVQKLYANASQRVPTGELNRVFKRILEQHSPPSVGGRSLRFYFAQQVAVRPPTFLIQANIPELIPTEYKRFLSNQIRAYYGFEGSALRFVFKRPAGRHRWGR